MSISVTDTLQTACTECGKKTNDGFYRGGLKYCRKCFWKLIAAEQLARVAAGEANAE